MVEEHQAGGVAGGGGCFPALLVYRDGVWIAGVGEVCRT